MEWLLHLLYQVLRYFKFCEKVKHGHIDVIGSGNVSIELGSYRNVLSVKFDDDESTIPPPCGGGLPDVFQWELDKKNSNHYHLNVTWSVQRPRRIAWTVSWC